MKVFVCLFAIVACASASAVLSTGTSTSSRTQDAAGNYAFSYNEQHSTGGSSRSESGNHWGAQGSYSLNVGDGRQRIVKYVADGAGFRAAISTNEPGTAALPAANTAINSPYAPPQAPPVPVVAAPAPVAVAAPLALPALAAPAPLAPAIAAPAPLLTNGWSNSAPVAVAPVVVKAVPAISSYSTAINHAAPAKAVIAAPLAVPAAPLLTNGWNSALPAALPAAPLLSGWN